jgi:hypothetical protein
MPTKHLDVGSTPIDGAIMNNARYSALIGDEIVCGWHFCPDWD